MKQLLQNLKNGTSDIIDVPCPQPMAGQLLIQTRLSLISSGTERMLIEFGKANWLAKARQQPDKVRMVLNKIKTDGLLTTFDAVQNKLEQALPMGYSNVGVVLEVGPGVIGWSTGDRVLSNGPHAEIVCVPQNLCAKIPSTVSDTAAAFTVLAAIGLQGIRLAAPTIGETFAVIGLGLIGLLTVQLLQAQGCRVIGIDYDETRLQLAKQSGAVVVNLSNQEDPIAFAQVFSEAQGIDGVLITAATDSHEPVHQAAAMCRKRGRIVLVGVTGLALSRADFYEKELSFQVSCSYGPGRYDANYEVTGQDYPRGFVRWTLQRNFAAILNLLAEQRLNVLPFITHHFMFTEAARAYAVLTSDAQSLAILLNYPAETTPDLRSNSIVLNAAAQADPARPVVGFMGAGNYASRLLIPAFQKTRAVLKTIVTTSGVNAARYGKKFNFAIAASDADLVWQDTAINTVVIATRHDSHAALVCTALAAGKHVFVEKPLCLNVDELVAIEKMVEQYPQQLLMVGFNRRFSRYTERMKTLLASMPMAKNFVMTVNAGAIPQQHWVQTLSIGGGRVIGECCHFIDLLRYLAGVSIQSVNTLALHDTTDTVSIQLKFIDGSIGTIHYFANGHAAFPKERLEVFCGNRVLQLDNFRALRGWGWPAFKNMRSFRQDKGQKQCAAAFISAIETGQASPIPLGEILEVTRMTIEAAHQLRQS